MADIAVATPPAAPAETKAPAAAPTKNDSLPKKAEKAPAKAAEIPAEPKPAEKPELPEAKPEETEKKEEKETTPQEGEGAAAEPVAPGTDEPAFTLTIDGEEKQVSAPELIEFVNEHIAKAVEIHDRELAKKKRRQEQPMHAAMDDLVEKHGGDRAKAYAELIGWADKLIAEELKWQQLPESDRRALEAERRARHLESQLKKREDAEKQEAKRGRTAVASEQVIKELREAISANGLPWDDDTRKLISGIVLSERRAGQKSTAATVAAKIRAQLDGIALKQLDVERLKKARPDIVESVLKSDLEAVRQARQEESATRENGQKAPPAGEPERHLKLRPGSSFFE